MEDVLASRSGFALLEGSAGITSITLTFTSVTLREHLSLSVLDNANFIIGIAELLEASSPLAAVEALILSLLHLGMLCLLLNVLSSQENYARPLESLSHTCKSLLHSNQ